MPETELIIIQRLQKQLQKSQQETKQLQAELDGIVYERLHNPSYNLSLEQELKDSSEWIGVLQGKLAEAKRANIHYEKQVHLANSRLHQSEASSHELNEKIAEIEQQNQELSEKFAKTEEALALMAKEDRFKEFENQIYTLKCQLEDQAHQTTLAEQHFAKKVKENALLKLDAEQKEAELSALKNYLEKAEIKLTEMTDLQELRQQQEQKVQKMMSETIKSLELQIRAWEEKSSYLLEKLQEMEQRNQELKKVEENYKQLQSLLARVGSGVDLYDKELELRSGTNSSIYLKKS